MSRSMERFALWLVLLAVGSVAHAKTVHLYYTDAQGTVVAKTDAQGNILARYDYRPYGAPVSGQAPSGPGYTGHVNDPEAGLVYMQQRYYDPVVGRFLSIDPITPYAGAAFKFNRYLYASGNPILNIDPAGLDDECSWYCQKMRALSDSFNKMGQDGMANVTGSGAGPGGEMRATLSFVNASANQDIGGGLRQAADITDPTLALVPGGAVAICITDDCNTLGTVMAVISAAPVGAVENALVKEIGSAFRASKIDRIAFRAIREAFWKAEAEANGMAYSAEDLVRMKRGRAPIGPDGFPMELHHVDRTPEGELLPMSRTDHRLGGNYKKNHSE